MTEYKPPALPIKSDGSISEIWFADDSRSIELPYYDTRVQAGFPSPAEDHLEQRLDLNTLVIENPSATFFVRVAGESMREIGITDGDILVVDRSIESWENRTVVLEAENPDYPPIRITEEMDFSVWGVVCWTLKKL